MKRKFETEIDVAFPPVEAIHLFTPKGEEAWVPGWRPRFIDPPSGKTVSGMVFETGEGEERTIWTCLSYDPRAGEASYLRLVPDTRISRVEVSCRENVRGGSAVTVRYEHVALTDAGESWLADQTQGAFEADIGKWRHFIEAAIGEGRISVSTAA